MEQPCQHMIHHQYTEDWGGTVGGQSATDITTQVLFSLLIMIQSFESNAKEHDEHQVIEYLSEKFVNSQG